MCSSALGWVTDACLPPSLCHWPSSEALAGHTLALSVQPTDPPCPLEPQRKKIICLQCPHCLHHRHYRLHLLHSSRTADIATVYDMLPMFCRRHVTCTTRLRFTTHYPYYVHDIHNIKPLPHVYTPHATLCIMNSKDFTSYPHKHSTYTINTTGVTPTSYTTA